MPTPSRSADSNQESSQNPPVSRRESPWLEESSAHTDNKDNANGPSSSQVNTLHTLWKEDSHDLQSMDLFSPLPNDGLSMLGSDFPVPSKLVDSFNKLPTAPQQKSSGRLRRMLEILFGDFTPFFKKPKSGELALSAFIGPKALCFIRIISCMLCAGSLGFLLRVRASLVPHRIIDLAVINNCAMLFAISGLLYGLLSHYVYKGAKFQVRSLFLVVAIFLQFATIVACYGSVRLFSEILVPTWRPRVGPVELYNFKSIQAVNQYILIFGTFAELLFGLVEFRVTYVVIPVMFVSAWELIAHFLPSSERGVTAANPIIGVLLVIGCSFVIQLVARFLHRSLKKPYMFPEVN